ncbi:MAG: hypothetical protein JWO57_197 [Pseudonocardiales bacterium]|nr:hypothetical protein [Pseudonocardiales bacterium]
MVEVTVRGELASPPDQVWALVGDFVGFLVALIDDPGVPITGEGAGVGMLRTLTRDGVRTVERLEGQDDPALWTSYSMPEPGLFPVRTYHSRIELGPLPDGRCAITWSAELVPRGVTDDEAAAAARGVYTHGITMLAKRFGGPGALPDQA